MTLTNHSPMTEPEQRALDQDGFILLADFMTADLRGSLRRRVNELFAEEGDQAGSEFKQEPQSRRLANLVNKGEVFTQIMGIPAILERVAYVIGPEFKLSSLNARSANPHSDWVQPLHADAGAIADERGFWVCNTVWMLDDFTTENGAIRMVPGSHRWGKLPQQVLADPKAAHPEEVLLTGKAGSVMLMNAHLWHGGTANHTPAHRRAVHVFYTRWDKPQQQYQKKLLSPAVQQGLTPQIRKLLALDDAENDRLSSQTAGQSGFLR
jgi:hypothetical protein